MKAAGVVYTLGTWGKTSQVFREPQLASTLDLPLCLARYLPRTMIRHKVTKTTTATTPPIKAWSVPCCPKAFGSEGRQGERERENGAMRAMLGHVTERRSSRGAVEDRRAKTEQVGQTICRSFPL